MTITWVELCMVQVRATSFDHTAPTVNNNYAQAHSSPDGNPFPLCPRPFRAQVLLYDPSSGDVQFLVFGSDLSLINQKNISKQYVFSSGNNFKVFDNRTQSLLREGATAKPFLSTVDATSFSLLSTLDTSIHNEELY